MDGSSGSNTFPIIISLVALLISTLGYLDNRRNLKINQESLNIVLKGESAKKNLEKCWSILLEISKDLKDLGGQDFIKDSKDFRNKVFSYKCEDSKITLNPSCTAIFTANPDIIMINEFDLSEIFSGLARIENDLNNLKGFEPLIRTFDSDFIELIDRSCQGVFNSLYKALDQKVYNFSFDNSSKRIKPSEITDTLYDSINYYDIMLIMEQMSEELKDRSEELSKTLGKQILNSS